MSAPPTDPGCMVLIVFDNSAFMYQPNNHRATNWTIIRLPELWGLPIGSVVHCGGKFYYPYSHGYKLYVIDPFIQEAASPLVMKYPHGSLTCANFFSLHEIGGELFLVQPLYSSSAIRGFQVFKADFSSQEWVMVETLGDHLLFISRVDCSVSLSAADVGFKRDSIYACKEFRRDGKDWRAVFAWGVFDLSTGGWTEEDTLLNISLNTWLLPMLDPANPAKASD